MTSFSSELAEEKGICDKRLRPCKGGERLGGKRLEFGDKRLGGKRLEFGGQRLGGPRLRCLIGS